MRRGHDRDWPWPAVPTGRSGAVCLRTRRGTRASRAAPAPARPPARSLLPPACQASGVPGRPAPAPPGKPAGALVVPAGQFGDQLRDAFTEGDRLIGYTDSVDVAARVLDTLSAALAGAAFCFRCHYCPRTGTRGDRP